jgi:hypothetical protein
MNGAIVERVLEFVAHLSGGGYRAPLKSSPGRPAIKHSASVSMPSSQPVFSNTTTPLSSCTLAVFAARSLPDWLTAMPSESGFF